MRDTDQARAFVDGIQQFIGINGDAIARFHHLHPHVIGHPAAQCINIAGEIQLADDHFVANWIAEIHTPKEDAVGDAGVLMHQDGVGRRAHQRRDLVADGLRQLEPACAPG